MSKRNKVAKLLANVQGQLKKMSASEPDLGFFNDMFEPGEPSKFGMEAMERNDLLKVYKVLTKYAAEEKDDQIGRARAAQFMALAQFAKNVAKLEDSSKAAEMYRRDLRSVPLKVVKDNFVFRHYNPNNPEDLIRRFTTNRAMPEMVSFKSKFDEAFS